MATGARREQACEELGVSVRTVQRWAHRAEDGRPGAVRAAPSNKLSEAERERVLAIANEPAYASLAPHQIVPRLADEGVYVASESTFYRVLKAANQQHRRGRVRRPAGPGGRDHHNAREVLIAPGMDTARSRRVQIKI